MERFKDLGKDRTGLGVMCFLVTRVVLIFVDVSCVGAYFGIMLCLLYLTFLKDCLEILIYAIAKFSTRLKWLYRIFKIKDILYTEVNEINTEANELESTILRSLDESVNQQTNSFMVKNSLDPVASSICNSASQYNSLLFNCSQSRNASSVIFESPRSSKSGCQEPLPRKLSSLSTQVVSSTENFTTHETNFEDIDLSNETEIDSKTSREELNTEESPSKWNVSKMKFLDHFRNNKLPSCSIKSQIGNLASKVTQILPHQACDNDKLLSDKNDSPEQVGCCSYLPHFLRPKYQMSSIASPYERF